MRLSPILFCLTCLSFPVVADLSDFSRGPVFPSFGENAVIVDGLVSPEKQRFKVAFDVYKKNESEGANRGFNSIARFINMHVRAGVPLENIEVAMVVHGEASKELMTSAIFEKRFSQPNGSEALVSELLAAGVKIQLCGQSAKFHDVANKELIEGVEMSLSAMTAHALLQQSGYTVNPF